MVTRKLLVVAGLLAFASVSTVWFASGTTGPEPRATPGTRLPDGFVVARGTRLVGPAFPLVDETGATPAWKAVLAVETDAANVVRSYGRQAKQLGFRQRVSTEPTCRRGFAEGVTCHASYLAPTGREVGIRVIVCSACPYPLSTAQLSGGPPEPSTPPSSRIIPLPPDTPTLRLSDAELARLREPIGAGTTISYWNWSLTVQPGSELATPPTAFRGCISDFVAVLAVTGQPTAVLDSYARELFVYPEFSRTTHRVDDATVTYRYDGIWLLTLIEGTDLDQPWLRVDACDET
jgi:hypothetical protein